MGDSELEELRKALGAGVGMEAGEQVVDEADAAGRSDAPGQEQGLGSGGRGGLEFLEIEVARGAVGGEDALCLVPGGRQQAFRFADELVGAADVTKVQEGLAGVDGEVGLGHPGASGWPVGAGVVEVLPQPDVAARHHAAHRALTPAGPAMSLLTLRSNRRDVHAGRRRRQDGSRPHGRAHFLVTLEEPVQPLSRHGPGRAALPTAS